MFNKMCVVISVLITICSLSFAEETPYDKLGNADFNLNQILTDLEQIKESKNFRFRTMAQRELFRKSIDATIDKVKAAQADTLEAADLFESQSIEIETQCATQIDRLQTEELDRQESEAPKVSLTITYTNAPLKGYSVFATDTELDELGVPQDRYIEVKGFLFNEGSKSGSVALKFWTENSLGHGENGWSIPVGRIPPGVPIPFETRNPICRKCGTASLRYEIHYN